MLLTISKCLFRSTLRCSKNSKNHINPLFYHGNLTHCLHFSTNNNEANDNDNDDGGASKKNKNNDETINRFEDNEREFIKRYGKTEPDWGVDNDCYLDADDVYIPYVTEDMRKEIWEKHKGNPTEWPAERLSNYFGLTMERMRATLYIMKDREEQMAKQGVLEIAPLWNDIYKAHTLDATLNTPTKLAEDFKIEETEVKNILAKMNDHHERIADLQEYTENMNIFVEDLRDAGATDVSFRESPSSKISVFDKQQTYFPQLLRDESYEEKKRHLLNRIARETKAKVVPTVDSLFSNLSTRPLPHKVSSTTSTTKPKKVTLEKKISSTDIKNNNNKISSVENENDNQHFEDNDSTTTPPSTTTVTTTTTAMTDAELLAAADAEAAAADPNAYHFSRWKYAFRDLSEPSLASKAPTMIRTRSGGWRVATPLEELNRSWSAKPDAMEMQTFGHKLDRFKDPDGDEERAKNIPKIKRLRYRALKLKLETEAVEASKMK